MRQPIIVLFCVALLTSGAMAEKKSAQFRVIESIEGDRIVFENGTIVRTTEQTRVEKKGYDLTRSDLRPGWAVRPRLDTRTASSDVPVVSKLQVGAVPLVNRFPAYRGVRDTIAIARAELGFLTVGETLGVVDVQQAIEIILASVLKATDWFNVVDLASRDEVLNEQDFARSGYGNREAAARGGRLISARYLAKATVVDFDLATRSGAGVSAFGVNFSKNKARSKLVMELRLVDTESGEIVDVVRTTKSFGADAMQFRLNLAETASSLVPFTGGGAIDDLEKLASAGISVAKNGFVQSPIGELFALAINDLVEKLLDRIADKPWQSIVVQVQDHDRVLIRGGADVGLETGAVFDVLKAGPDLIDPETGEVLERSTSRIGIIQVVEVRERVSLATILHGSGVTRGDRCELKGGRP